VSWRDTTGDTAANITPPAGDTAGTVKAVSIIAGFVRRPAGTVWGSKAWQHPRWAAACYIEA
jgi:hypothetical protein